MRLSIVVPAHNEERRIGPMLEAYLPYFTSRYGDEVEFLIVINGSTDKTDQVVADYAARSPGRRLSEPLVKAIIEPNPIGKGGALMVGFRQAQGDLIGFVDADGATPPEAFQELVENIGEAGGIIASRWAKGSQVSPRQPLDRRVASRIFNLMTRTLFGLKLTDTQCGAKLMRREAVQAILPHLGITQWAFDVDLLFQLRRAGYAIREIPTTWHDVEGSKIQVGKASTEMIMAMVRLRLLYSRFSWVVDFYNRFLGPWIHPEGTVRDYLLTHSLMLFLGAQFSNICNLLFQVIMARMLGNTDYGELFAILSALMLLGAPLGALGGAVTHFTALFMAGSPGTDRGDSEKRRNLNRSTQSARREENCISAGGGEENSSLRISRASVQTLPLGFFNAHERIKDMMAALGRDLLVPVLVIILGVILARQELMTAFKLDTPWPVYIAGGTAVVMLLGAVPAGVLAGMQAFEWAALIGNGWTVLRLVLGIILAFFGLGAIGGLTAHMVGILVSAVLSMVICGSLLGSNKANQSDIGGANVHNRNRNPNRNLLWSAWHWAEEIGLRLRLGLRLRFSEQGRPAGIYSYMGGYMAAFTAFGVLTSADVLLVKYYFSPEQAGIFSKAAMVARMVWFLPGPVCSAMFPKVTSSGGSTGATHRTLVKAMVVTGLIVVSMGLVCMIFPEFLLKVLAKQVQPGQIEILRGMILALTPLTMMTVLLNYELAQRRFRIMIPVALCAAGYLLGVMRWHETPLQVVGVLGAMSTVGLGLSWFFVRGTERT